MRALLTGMIFGMFFVSMTMSFIDKNFSAMFGWMCACLWVIIAENRLHKI